MKRVLKKYYVFYRLFYVLISIFLIIPLLKFTAQMDQTVIIDYVPILNILRHILMYGSLALFAWAFFIDYDSLTFFGIRQILSFGKTKEANLSNEIKRSGLLGIVRHPMYFAVIIYLVCRIQTWADLIMGFVLIAYTVIGTILEEKKLVLEFGEPYITYQKEVPMLIPFTKVTS